AEAENIHPRLLENLRREYRNGNVDVIYLLSALHNFALDRRARGDTKQAESLLREAIALTAVTNENQNKQIGISEIVLTLTLADQGKFDEAEDRVQNQIAELKKDSMAETSQM